VRWLGRSLALPCLHPSVHRIPENFNAIGRQPAGKRPCKRPANVLASAHLRCETQPGASAQPLRGVGDVRAKKRPPGSDQDSRRLLNLHPSGVEPETFGSEVISYTVFWVLFCSKHWAFCASLSAICSVSTAGGYTGWVHWRCVVHAFKQPATNDLSSV